MRHTSQEPEAEAGAPLLAAADPPCPGGPVVASGKLLSVDGRTLWVRGVTYGTFRPAPTASTTRSTEPSRATSRAMAAAGFNAVRTYTVPPAGCSTLRRRTGCGSWSALPWEQHVAFLDDRGGAARDRGARARRRARPAPAIPPCSATRIGNEIPAPDRPLARPPRVERFLARLCRGRAGPRIRARWSRTSNYPTTEYLELPFLDFVAFNVYLEAPRSARRLSRRACRTSPAIARCSWPRSASTAAATARSSRRAASRWQVRTRVRGGLRRRVRLRVDRRVASRRPRHRGLGLRPHRPASAGRSRRWPALRRALAEVPFPPDDGRGRASRWSSAATTARAPSSECLDRPRRARLPGLRGDRVDDGSTDATAAHRPRATACG